MQGGRYDVLNRGLTALIITYWVASMLWLTVTKLIPVLRPGDRPVAGGWSQGPNQQPLKVRWQVLIQNQLVGTAVNEVTTRDTGGWRVHSTISFTKLPMDLIVSELLGGLAAVFQPALLEAHGLPLSLQVVTRMDCTATGQMERFHAHVRVDDVEDAVSLRGVIQNGKLQLLVTAADPAEGVVGRRIELYRQELSLPPEAMLADSLAPAPRLQNLHVGQEWTFHAYRLFPPTRPLRLMRGTVSREELILWDGQLEPVRLVELFDEEGSSISVARQPTCRLWVRKDGEVLRQQMALGDLRFEFVRMLDLPVGQGVETQDVETDVP